MFLDAIVETGTGPSWKRDHHRNKLVALSLQGSGSLSIHLPKANLGRR